MPDHMRHTSGPQHDVESRNLRTITDVLQFWNTQNIQGILEHYDDDIVWTNVALEQTYRGKQEVAGFLTQLFKAFPDLSFEVLDKFASGDNIAERWVIRGTHRGTFMGIPPTGRAVELPGISMVRMREGRFLDDWYLFDGARALRQMGLLPPLSASETTLMRAALWAAVHLRWIALAAIGIAAVGLLRRTKI